MAEAAESFLGTPFHDNGRIPGVGLDCTGVIVCAARIAGMDCPDYDGPTSGDRIEAVRNALSTHFMPVVIATEKEVSRGDVLLFRARSMWNHMGIALGDDRFVHAWDVPSASVVALGEIGDWYRHLHGVWRAS